jgi:uncharacterized cupredoxin-like copper-binding protein
MAVYFVLGAFLVAWALILTFGGMARGKDFPDASTGRLLMFGSAGLALAVFIAMIATTEKEHPRLEAKEKAAEEKEAKERASTSGEAQGQEGGQKQKAGGPVLVTEKEYSIQLPAKAFDAGPYGFEVENDGKVPHDLAVEKAGVVLEKTPLIDGGKSAKLEVQLDPAKYKLYCTVPGHEQLGMKTEIEVR